MTTFTELKQKAIELETQINRHTVEIQKIMPTAAWAASQASDALAHIVVEWLTTAEKNEEKSA